MYQQEPSCSFWAALSAASILSSLGDDAKAQYHITNAYRDGVRAVQEQCRLTKGVRVIGALNVSSSWFSGETSHRTLFGQRWERTAQDVDELATAVGDIREIAIGLGVSPANLPVHQLLRIAYPGKPSLWYVTEQVPPDGWELRTGNTDLGTVIIPWDSTIIWTTDQKGNAKFRITASDPEIELAGGETELHRGNVLVDMPWREGRRHVAAGTYRGVRVEISGGLWTVTVVPNQRWDVLSV